MIEKTLQDYQCQINDYLHTSLETLKFPAIKIQQAIEYSVFPGGKRLRPILVYLSGELFGIDQSILNTIAASIELIHCYSLVHDDLPAMDDDELRRGRPTCHRYFDEATGILAGDGLQALALEVIFSLENQLAPHKVLAIGKEITHASGPHGMVSGQSLDLTELDKPSVDEDTLEYVHQLKTGKLIQACCQTVIHADNSGNQEQHAALKHYAKHVGIAFQIQDDYLDKYGDTASLGKKQGSDEDNNKTTYATLYDKEQLQQIMMNRYQAALDALTPFGHKSKRLEEFTQYLLKRTH